MQNIKVINEFHCTYFENLLAYLAMPFISLYRMADNANTNNDEMRMVMDEISPV